MVRSYPETVLVVYLDIPHLQTLRQPVYALGQHQLAHGIVPAVFFLDIDKGVLLSNHVQILLLVYQQFIVLAFQHTMVVHPGVFPFYVARFAVQAKQLSGIGHDDQSTGIVGHGCNTIVLLDLVLAIAHLELLGLLRLRVVIEDSLFVELDPVVLVFVDIDSFHGITSGKEFLHHTAGIPFKLLRDGIVDTIVHALLQPQTSLCIFHDLLGIVVTHGGRVAHIREEGLHPIAVIAVQAIGCTYPHKTAGVTEDTVHL